MNTHKVVPLSRPAGNSETITGFSYSTFEFFNNKLVVDNLKFFIRNPLTREFDVLPVRLDELQEELYNLIYSFFDHNRVA